MRNLKRALSLALASVMLLGMMVVGTSAASFPDVDDNDNVEAIEVLKATGVMIGDNGYFKPDENVTRNEMAVIMTNLLGLNPNDFAGACPFTDVQPWAQNYVAACYANGIIAGRSATVFDGQATVTGVEAAAMMMRALGYFQYAEDYEGGFEAATVRQAAKIHLFDDIDTGANSAMDRNNVAQLALNSLKADTVDFTGTLGMMVDMGDGKSVRVGFRSEYTPLRQLSNHNYNNATSGHDVEYQQLAEKLYGSDLKLDTTQTDGSGRPANKWSYKYVAIGTYTKTPHIQVVVDKRQTLEDEMKDINRNYTVAHLYLNGTEQTFANWSAMKTGFSVREGDVLDIYMDDGNANVVKAASITRYMAKQLTADAVTRNQGSNLEVRVPGVINTYEKADDVLGYEGLKKDDVIYYYQDRDGVYHLSLAGSFEGQLTSIKGANTNLPDRYVIDGKDYCANQNMNTGADADHTIPGITTNPVYNTQYRYYTDANGYIVFAEEVENESKDYVVIQEIKYVTGDGSISGSDRVEARLVKMDGTTEIKTLDSIKLWTGSAYETYKGIGKATEPEANSDGTKKMAYDQTGIKLNATLSTDGKDREANSTFFTYSTTGSKYALTEVKPTSSRTTGLASGPVENKQAVAAGVAVNNNTVFIVANESGKNGFTVYNGKDAVPKINAAVGSYVAKDGVATYMYIHSFTGDKVMSGNSVFIMSTEKTFVSNKKEDGSSAPYNEYHAIVNGEATTVKVKADDAGNNNLDSGSVSVGLFDPTYDSDGRITKLTVNTLMVQGYGYNNAGGVLSVTSNSSATTSAAGSAKVWVLNEKGEIENLAEMTVDELKKDADDHIYIVRTNATPPMVEYVFIREMESDVALSSLTVTGGGIAQNISTTGGTVYTQSAVSYTIAGTAREAGAVVNISTDGGTTWGANDASATVTSATQAAAAASKTVLVKVTCLTGVTQTYTVTLTTPATPAAATVVAPSNPTLPVNPTDPAATGSAAPTITVKPGSGVATADQPTMGNIVKEEGKKDFAIVKVTVPVALQMSGVAIRQTNNALSMYYSADPTVGANAGVDANQKFKTGYDFGSGDTTLYIMVLVGENVTLEFDKAGCTGISDFKADYILTVSGSGVTLG